MAVAFAARDRDEAGRKLNQIYVGCEILESREPQPFGLLGLHQSAAQVVTFVDRDCELLFGKLANGGKVTIDIDAADKVSLNFIEEKLPEPASEAPES